MIRWHRIRGARQGLTVVELVIAVGLLALLMSSVFGVMRGFIGVWDKSEVRRARVEESFAVAELFADDLAQLDGGQRGDLVAQWVPFDTDGDGGVDSVWPRLLLVRHASNAEFARLQTRSRERDPGLGLIEVAWVVVPGFKGKDQPERRSEGLVLRGERIATPKSSEPAAPGAEVSFFDPRFFARSGQPTPGVLNEVSGGVLWFGLEFATQTTTLKNGWHTGTALADACTSWDAWRKGRPDPQVHSWNEPGTGMPRAKKRALLPRRVKLELEFERPKETLRRTRLAEFLPLQANTMRVEDYERLPATPDAFVKIDGEWLKIGQPSGAIVSIQRGMRGTSPANHDRGARVHHGETFRREIPIRLSQEDWDL